MRRLAVAIAAVMLAAIAPSTHATAAAPPPGRSGEVIRAWTALAMDTARATRATDAAAARLYAMVDVAMFDAVNGLAPHLERRQPALVAPDATAEGDPVVAASAAAHDVLVALYPQRAPIYADRLEDDVAAASSPASAANGRRWGGRVATAVLEARRDDGSSPSETLSPPHSPAAVGEFAATWSNTQYRNLEPFAIADSHAYVSNGPPALTSVEYADAYAEVRQIGGRDTIDPAADATYAYWRFDTGTVQPPGGWLQIATEVSPSLSLFDTARLFALEAMALADTVAPTYTSKAANWFWRPTTAINRAGEDGNDATAPPSDGTAWVARAGSAGSSPEHVSGHSSFSAAGATVLAGFFCRDRITFTLTSDPAHNGRRTYTSFSAAAAEAGRSRVLGGVHFEFSNQAGLDAGSAVGDEVLANSLLRVHGPTHNGDCPR